MSKLNHEAAPNLNMTTQEISTSKLVSTKKGHAFSEELSDGGERNEFLKKQAKKG